MMFDENQIYMYIKFETRLKVIVAIIVFVHFSQKLRPMKCQWERNVISSKLLIKTWS